MKHHIGHLLGIVTVSVIFCVIILAEVLYFEANPPQLSNLTKQDWIANFEFWAYICVGSAIVASILWYIFAQRVFKTDNQKSYGKRGRWGFLFLLPAVAIGASILLVEQAKSSLWLAYMFFIVNGLLPYYLATLVFSPVAVKYTPIGAKGIRSRCPW